jgi:hypothetical protein
MEKTKKEITKGNKKIEVVFYSGTEAIDVDLDGVKDEVEKHRNYTIITVTDETDKVILKGEYNLNISGKFHPDTRAEIEKIIAILKNENKNYQAYLVRQDKKQKTIEKYYADKNKIEKMMAE